jgi:hypothetical protein
VKVTKGKLRKILREYEQYVDKDGNVWDDEGNVTKKGADFGKRYGGDTYGTNAPWNSRRTGSGSSQKRKTSYVGTDSNASQIAAVEKVLAAKPNNFLNSILSQLKNGRGLSSRQKSIVKKIVAKASPDDATLFESSSASGEKWSEGDLVDAIRDYSKELTGRRNTYGHPDDLESLSHQELSDHYEGMFDSPEAAAFRSQRELEDQRSADHAAGYEDEAHPLERSPLRQGMQRRQEATEVALLRNIISERLLRMGKRNA